MNYVAYTTFDCSSENQKLQQAEMSRLKREVERLEQENAFLKKVATYFTKESK